MVVVWQSGHSCGTCVLTLFHIPLLSLGHNDGCNKLLIGTSARHDVRLRMQALDFGARCLDDVLLLAVGVFDVDSV
jgi:hypothetical protein